LNDGVEEDLKIMGIRNWHSGRRLEGTEECFVWKLTSVVDCSVIGGVMLLPHFPSQISYGHGVRSRW